MTLLIPQHPELPTQDILRAALVLSSTMDARPVLKALIFGLYQTRVLYESDRYGLVKLHHFSTSDSLGNELRVIRLFVVRDFFHPRIPDSYKSPKCLIELVATPIALYETCNMQLDSDDIRYPQISALFRREKLTFEGEIKGRYNAVPFSEPYGSLIPDQDRPMGLDVYRPKPIFPRSISGDGNGGGGRDGNGVGGGNRGDGGNGGPDGGNGNGGGGGDGGGAGLADVLRHNVLFSAPERLFNILDQL